MKEALHARLQLVFTLADIRHRVIQDTEPNVPTKAHEITGLLKVLLQSTAAKLPDAEPSTITVTAQQKQIATIANGQVAIRTTKLRENLERVEAMLLSDHTGNPLLDWTDEQKAQAQTYLANEIAAIQQAIEDL